MYGYPLSFNVNQSYVRFSDKIVQLGLRRVHPSPYIAAFGLNYFVV
jgi:hypothetical protein